MTLYEVQVLCQVLIGSGAQNGQHNVHSMQYVCGLDWEMTKFKDDLHIHRQPRHTETLHQNGGQAWSVSHSSENSTYEQ